VLWSEKPFELEFNYPFKDEKLHLQPAKIGWKSSSDNGYCLFCLRPHNNAKNLFSYILNDHNFNLDLLRASGRHFYSTSQGINTVAIQRAYRRFCASSDTVRQSTEQLGVLISKLSKSKKQTESVQSFIFELFGVFRDVAQARSRWSLSRYRSPRLLTPHTATKRSDKLFLLYDYVPYTKSELTWFISNISAFGPRFQARLIPKLLYDMVCHSWIADPCMSLPPFPLADFYTDDFMYAGPDISHSLPPNPTYQALRRKQLAIFTT
jgi:hypothetical protein